MNKSKKRAYEILNHYKNIIIDEMEELVKSIILVGSLSNGSYIPGPGRDIDQITILEDKANNNQIIRANEIIEKTEEKFNNDIPIARTVYKLGQMQRPFNRNIDYCKENKHLLELPIELFRIHDSGKIIYGNKNIKRILPVPKRDEVIKFEKRNRKDYRKLLKNEPEIRENLKNPPVRIAVQIILTTAMKHFYFATGNSCSNKHKIAERMKDKVVNYKFQKLLDLATEFKLNPDTEFENKKIIKLRKGCKKLMNWMYERKVDSVPLKK
ncbi:MAG: hypothetical protein FXF47_08625 [Candidatus Mcinerneyibacterium aminivorans]|jgi:predicted nucleotidyltransferase|uniref:Polymerase nucleotidyl transferase domain-containing protein n=1 Tax=Candidatus Mcinerneyibacterium aminivorans TaxID=2703815 RepID=A0A5D0MA34_9BACT|nr:MAG: hypothetical protein FXF47_08625 [Candidatus Mcinerneyibacterium aminivorans]